MEPRPLWERWLFVCLIPVIGFSFVYITAQPYNPRPYIIAVFAIAIEYVLWRRDKQK